MIGEPRIVAYFAPDDIVPGPCVAVFEIEGGLTYTFGGRYYALQENYLSLNALGSGIRETLRTPPNDANITPHDSLYLVTPERLIIGSRQHLRHTLKQDLLTWHGSATDGLIVATFIGNYRLLAFWNEIAGNALSMREVDDCVRLGRLPLGLKPAPASLSTLDYYQRLFACLELAQKRICAISLMSEPEWTDSVLERRFFELTLEAAGRGVEIHRIFVMTDQIRRRAVSSMSAVRAHCEGKGPATLRGFVVPPEKIQAERVGDGFIAFDDDIVLVDAFENGEPRGKISKNSDDIARLLSLHRQLRLHSEELTL